MSDYPNNYDDSSALATTEDLQAAIMTLQHMVGTGLQKLTPPPGLSDWTVFNQGSTTIEDYRGNIRLAFPANTALGIRGIRRDAPSTPYKITAGLRWMPSSQDGSHVCLGWRDSIGGKLAVIRCRRAATPTINSSKYTSETAFSADYANHAVSWVTGQPLVWLQIEDDGTNRKVRYSNDGINFITLHSVGRSDFLTGDQIVFGLDSSGGAAECYAVLQHYEEA